LEIRVVIRILSSKKLSSWIVKILHHD